MQNRLALDPEKVPDFFRDRVVLQRWRRHAMRYAWLKLGASFGLVGALLLAVPAFAQTQTTAPPILTQPPMALPDLAPPSQAVAPAGTASAPAQAAATSAVPTKPKPTATAIAKAHSQAAAPAAEVVGPGEAKPLAKTKQAAKHKRKQPPPPPVSGTAPVPPPGPVSGAPSAPPAPPPLPKLCLFDFCLM
jgi:hypothetical protein